MSILVTGGAGFIGSNLVDKLIKKKYKVIVVDNLSTGFEKNINKKAEFVHIDLAKNLNQLIKLLKHCKIVFHLAALPRIQPSFDDPIVHNNSNVNATLNLLVAMKENKCEKIVYSSSSSCYGNPTEIPTSENCNLNFLNPYALQKFVSEKYVMMLSQKYGFSAISLRYFNVYGKKSFNKKNPFNAYSSVIGIFNYHKKNNLKIKVTGNGLQKRDFVHVEDVVEANIKAMNTNIENNFFNVGTGKAIEIIKVAKLFTDNYEFIPARLGEADVTCANIDKIKSQLDWKPKIKLLEAIKNDLI